MRTSVLIATLLVLSSSAAGASLDAPLESSNSPYFQYFGAGDRTLRLLARDSYGLYALTFPETLARNPAPVLITTDLPEIVQSVENYTAQKAPELGTLSMSLAALSGSGLWFFIKSRERANKHRRRVLYKVRREKRMMAF